MPSNISPANILHRLETGPVDQQLLLDAAEYIRTAQSCGTPDSHAPQITGAFANMADMRRQFDAMQARMRNALEVLGSDALWPDTVRVAAAELRLGLEGK